ncbi:hypothetical protein K491DRAFT_696518 [Lophiostoma macrostomum CBS 122681]|uniref:Uncharacterized protein n=1 Tax=Lophiostoma macrostomum CBS 122681 TaxID=1314788 RepID=A0A6A6SUY9_9PLEO|nr:hypothetical protein K491DRAFT_696518 [Lophiostoma macrostomum CBS 122681]
MTEKFIKQSHDWDRVPRPDQESHRMHCPEMTVTGMGLGEEDVDEGKHSWYLQGNLVGKGTSVFEGEMVKRYHVVWDFRDNPRFERYKGREWAKTSLTAWKLEILLLSLPT